MKTISKHQIKKWFESEKFINFYNNLYFEYLKEKRNYNETDIKTKKQWLKDNKSFIYKKYKQHLKEI